MNLCVDPPPVHDSAVECPELCRIPWLQQSLFELLMSLVLKTRVCPIYILLGFILKRLQPRPMDLQSEAPTPGKLKKGAQRQASGTA